MQFVVISVSGTEKQKIQLPLGSPHPISTNSSSSNLLSWEAPPSSILDKQNKQKTSQKRSEVHFSRQ